MRARDSAAQVFRPYVPVNDRQVRWAEKNLPAIRAAMIPAETSDERARVVTTLGRFLAGYLPMTQNLSERQANSVRQQMENLSADLADDLSDYPLWAIEAAIREYRRSEEGRFALKTSGALIPHLERIMAPARETLRACDRILESERRGNNVDALRERLSEAAKIGGEAHAETALGIAQRLDLIAPGSVDPVASDLQRECWRIWETHRAEHPRELPDSLRKQIGEMKSRGRVEN